jgi:hypothetical protein
MAQPARGEFITRPNHGTDPKGGHPPPDPPCQATLRGPEQRVSEPEDSGRLRAGGPSGATGRDPYPAAELEAAKELSIWVAIFGV